jgi:hypothetical protein
MKRTNIVFAALCGIALLAVSCSQGTLATRQADIGSTSISKLDVDHIEHLLKQRFLTPLQPSVNLRHEIRMEAQNKDPRVYHDDMYWLNWAHERYPANMQPNGKFFGAGTKSDLFGR